MPDFSHIDKYGKATMVDVGAKPVSRRTAKARALVFLPDEVLSRLDNDEIRVPKGAVFQTAVLAGIMAAKKTGDLIPLCHPLGLDNCRIDIRVNDRREIQIECTASVEGKTGVEMEALTGVSVAALTIYDMCKALSHEIVIRDIRLLEKTGGKKDYSFDP